MTEIGILILIPLVAVSIGFVWGRLTKMIEEQQRQIDELKRELENVKKQ